MKKIYNIPEVKVLKIQTMTMIAASTDANLGGASEYSGGGTLSGSRGVEDMLGFDFE